MGVLHAVASSILMTVLYVARYARPDLMRITCYLATFVHAWTPECDRRLYRMVCYINSTLGSRHIAWVGDYIDMLSVHMYNDADFAGCVKSQRSTAGVHLEIEADYTCFSIVWLSGRHGAVSTSTPEAEMLS